MTLVDFHTHFIPADLPDSFSITDEPRWPHLVVEDDGQSGAVFCGQTCVVSVPASCWDLPSRLDAMDRAHVDVHVISPLPVSLTYWADPLPALQYARHINDAVSKASRESSGRIRGLGTVPLQAPALAIDEMRRAMTELDLSGIEIGTVVAGTELAAPELRPFFRAAQELQVPLFVHPVNPEGATRLSCRRAALSVGSLTDTALAAISLVAGGVLREFPRLRVCLSHGGGSFAWIFPRMDWTLGVQADGPTAAELAAKLYVDTIVFDPLQLHLIKARFGADHIVAGSDFPFLPFGLRATLDEAVTRGICSPEESEQICEGNALRFLARSSVG